ncbi:sulfurtransferase [Flavobacterium sediminilitoris]|uniref:Sulfurtransferase n=1 Tax=Flavobacterium sediminilitoris TaxID=2024526 RepID=A0ABY4HLY6_9FLAO|nr:MULTISPECIES: sulfurtransferase [Flavobacterium]UOX33868.1 sulfurtransferase [Flavobacterium sediminilitoris]
MKQQLPPLINATELLTLHHTSSIILIDASNGKNAYDNYLKSHLQGALFVDLNTQLADIKEDVAVGGRHPLPTLEQFSKVLSDLGITPESHVVVYDDKNGANASARFWWMMKAVGHEKVQVLNGGKSTAEAVGFPLAKGIEKAEKVGLYPVTNWQLPQVTLNEVEKASQSESHIIIDVRETARYKGHVEPLDLIAGHIPNAVNVPFSTNLDENGLFLSPSLLKEKYETVFKDIPIENRIVHCGSGVTACHTLLAIASAGLDIPKLYVGSWSEWSRNEKEIVTEE